MASEYVELHAKSFYSFGMGASHAHELLARAGEHGYDALALTDTNLCGALEFARLANSLGIRPVTGAELTLADGSRLTLLARTRQGYAHVSRLLTLANAVDRREPRLDPAHLPAHAAGVLLLTGGRGGPLSRLARDGRRGEAVELLRQYAEWYGPGSVYVELQGNFLRGDTARNRELTGLAREAVVPLIATNDVHYHRPGRYRLQHALVAARRNTTIDRALPYIRPNHHLHLKSQTQMAHLFRDCPEAVANTHRAAEQCEFNLGTDLGYTLPDPQVPEGYTPQSYLERLCHEAAARRYGSVSEQVERAPAGGVPAHTQAPAWPASSSSTGRSSSWPRGSWRSGATTHPETPLEERPPGRGRGSSVALLVGYLIGISHVDPLRWGLTLERFISEDMSLLPDIDLDFPRGLRDELIRRVHRHFGPEYAVLAGAVATYSVKGIIQDLGKALGLPTEDLKLLSRQLHSHDAADLRAEMLDLPAFRDRVDAAGWRDLVQLAPQLMDAPRSLGQHVGGMVLSDSPISGMVPIRAGAMDGPLHHGLEQGLRGRRGLRQDRPPLPAGAGPDRGGPGPHRGARGQEAGSTRHRPRGPRGVRHDQRGPLQGGLPAPVARPAQDGAALEVSHPAGPGLPGGAHPARRRRPGQRGERSSWSATGMGRPGSTTTRWSGAPWSGATASSSGRSRWSSSSWTWRACPQPRPTRSGGPSPNQATSTSSPCTGRRFLEGALGNGVSEEAARRIFAKINGHYMFPESHSHAFAVTAYQAAWLKRHHPLEFFVSLDEQSAHGLLPLRDPQAGRPALRRALPQPLRQPQPGAVYPSRWLRPAGSPVRQGRGGGGRPAHGGGA